MKRLKQIIAPLFILVILGSCTSVRVVTDYDREADFGTYKSFAFYKTGIDKAQISDLDKKRILKAIDGELSNRGMVKSKQPDMLISIFTKEKERVDVYNNPYGFGWGMGWGFYNPWFWGAGWGPGWGGTNVSTRTEGALYIDIIDAKTKELVWQGKGTGVVGSTKDIAKKEERIRDFVSRILEEYPPNAVAVN